MKNLLVIIFMITGLTAFGQKFSLKGQLADSVGAPMPSATVLLLSAKDSSLVNFTLTDAAGNFQMKNVNGPEHFLKISFVGFRTFTKKLTTPAPGAILDIGQIKMEPVSSELEAIEIAAERAPVTIRKDTIEFNAGSFKTKQNAVVEDLLKKLPGVEVDNDGNITAQGERVRRVTVDGKNFFGADPKVATKNLPADAIDKVQVYDKKSDQAAFSGIDDGQREKTINLELKEEKRNGAFGTLMAGAGTDDRFQSRLSLNRFTKTRQLSLLGMGNNVNEQGFSMEEYMNFTGGSQQMMSGGGAVRLEFSANNSNGVPLSFGNRGNGIMTTYAAGLNLNNQFSNKTELNGSYFFNYLDHDRDQTTERENFLPIGSYMFNQNSRQQNYNKNHRINATLDHKIDSSNSLKLTTNFSLNDTDTNLSSSSETISSEGELQNESQTLSLASGTSTSLNASLLWRHKFGKKGRTLSLNLQQTYSDNERDGYLESVNEFYGPSPQTRNLEQQNFQQTENISYGSTLSFTEPLGKRKYLEANYSYRANLNDVNRDVYDVNSGESVFNEELSNEYNSNYQYHRAGLNFRMVRPKFNVVAGSSFQKTNLQGELTTLGVDVDRSFENILPSVRFSYDFSTSRHLGIEYETSVQEPTIQQLQPAVINTDPLNLYVGNPELRPAYSQVWRVNFRAFDPATFVNFFAFVDIDKTTNAIVNSQTFDPQIGQSTTKPVNVAGSTRLSGNANFGFPINKLKSRLNFGATYRAQQTTTLLNDIESDIDQRTLRGTARYTFQYKEIFDLTLSAEADKQFTYYEFNQPDQSFINQTYTSEANLSFLKNYQFSGMFEYLTYKNEKTNFNQSIPLLNLSVSRFVLKNKVGELKFSVNNLLDKALGINQTATINFLERQVTNSMGRYFMVSFTYALNKQLNPMGMRGGRGGGFRIIRN